MSAEELRRHFRRVYPECSRRDIENLVSAIISKKYWRVHPSRSDIYYAVALTRAKISCINGFRAKSTAPGPVVVSPRAARFCRRGRVLLVRRGNGGTFTSETVIDWPTFLRLIRLDEDKVYKYLIEDPNPPAFLNRRAFAALLRKMRADTMSTPHC
ncbi:MAG: hypothetical protein QXN98_00130 [Candidatus Bathyarchaeia archaeon]